MTVKHIPFGLRGYSLVKNEDMKLLSTEKCATGNGGRKHLFSATCADLFLLLFVVVNIAFMATAGAVGYIAALVSVPLLFFFSFWKIERGGDLGTLLAFPVALSAFQNVYLGVFSPQLSKFSVQLLVIINFVYAITLLLFLLVSRKTGDNSESFSILIKNYIAILILCSLLSAVISRGNPISMISSFRNIISVLLFFYMGYIASSRCDVRSFYEVLVAIGVVVVIFGFVDVASRGELWKSLNITDLWTKKGIALQPSGLPTNFYSSETINGSRIRRMASSFADPVNLGSFLFVVFVLCWRNKHFIFAILTIFAIALTVSKGALLGLLIFFCVYAYHRLPRFVFVGTLIGTFCVGVAFLLFASNSGANSVFVHISGFTSAFKSLLNHPFGNGLGSNGVLARQFSDQSANSDITESGIGMIIGQIGLIGLVVYVLFFLNVTRLSFTIRDEENRILAGTLVISLLVNICFNEVALSPNTCAAYMLIVGLCIGSEQLTGRSDLRTFSNRATRAVCPDADRAH